MSFETRYRIRENLYRGPAVQVYRAFRREDDLPVVLKVLADERPDQAHLEKFRLEYKILKGLDSPRVIRAYSLVRLEQTACLELEDPSGDALSNLFQGKEIAIEEFFSLALKIVEGLGDIHAGNIIHGDLNSSNIIFNPETGELKIIDFGSAFSDSETSYGASASIPAGGSLPYIAPERTGRLSQGADYRSDYYSLGAVLYEILLNRPPFQAEDPGEYAYLHIALEPPSPSSIRSDVPAVLSEIILKLLAKEPGHRYQSMQGLETDLRRCLREYRDQGSIAPFSLGESDIQGILRKQEVCFGREPELRDLRKASRRARAGAFEIIFISGEPGIGKTYLAEEFGKRAIRDGGLFVCGRGSRAKKNIPYASLIQAMREILRHTLAEPEEVVSVRRRSLREALSPNTGVITELLPEAEILLGAQPPVPPLEPGEARNRFIITFRNFIAHFASFSSPLMLFLDDLQWADQSSLDLLPLIAGDGNIKNFLLILTYRPEENSFLKKLREIKKDMADQGAAITEMELKSFSEENIGELVRESLRGNIPDPAPLAAECLRKTRGNPFFIRAFLLMLSREKYLYRDESVGWSWDLEAIRAHRVTDNVIDFLSSDIRRLNEKNLRVLKCASCFGLAVSRSRLRETVLMDADDFEETLREIIEKNYLIAPRTGDMLAFSHDRVLQAAYSLLSEEEKRDAHMRIGWALHEAYRADPRATSLFDAVSQFNRSRGFSRDSHDRLLPARLNLEAARLAKKTAAFSLSWEYVRAGLNLIRESDWKDEYEIAYGLRLEGAEAAFLTGDFGAMERLIEEGLSHARVFLDEVKLEEIRIQSLISRNLQDQAVKAALPLCARLGAKFPEKKAGRLLVLRNVLKVRRLLKKIKITESVVRGVASDPEKEALLNVLGRIGNSIYRTRPDLYPLAAAKRAELSLSLGVTSHAPLAYVGFGVILNAAFGDYRTAYGLYQTAEKLLSLPGMEATKSKVILIGNTFISPWKKHLKETLPSLQNGYRAGLDSGDFAFAGLNLIVYSKHLFFMGRPLRSAEKIMRRARKSVRETREEGNFNYTKPYYQTLRNLMGDSKRPWELNGKFCREKELLRDGRKKNDLTGESLLYFLKAYLSLFLHRHKEGFKNLEKALRLKDSILSTIEFAQLYYMEALYAAALYPEASLPGKKLFKRKMKSRVAWMKKRAAGAPENFLHKQRLMEAEAARIAGKNETARIAYDEAISLARKTGCLPDEALANELAGAFWLKIGTQGVAKSYLQEAYYLYEKWDAVALTDRMRKQYPEYLRFTETGFSKKADRSSTSDGADILASLDIRSVLQASSAIAAKLELDPLLRTMLKIIMENAGGRKGALLLKDEGEYRIEAYRDVTDGEFSLPEGRPAYDCGLIFAPLINYVLRTGESMIVSNAQADQRYSSEEYIRENEVRSLLCMPIIRREKIIGLAYLENNRTAGAFTPDRLELLRILCSQAAIFIINARLYESMEDKVRERTSELASALETLREKNEETQTELEIARRIQQGILPAENGEKKCLKMRSYYKSMREVGGDFFDEITLSDGRNAIIIADVSGHGVPAALLTTMLKLSFSDATRLHDSPAKILAYINDVIVRFILTGQYLTAFCMIVDQNGRLSCANAGHQRGIILRRSGGETEEMIIKGMIIGFLDSAGDTYMDAEFQCESGDRVLLFTDGLVEARNEAGDVFSPEGLKSFLSASREMSLDEQFDKLMSSWKQFVGAAESRDDVTALLLELK